MNGNKPTTLITAIRGPIILITIGVLFALDHMTRFTFNRSWPAILIVVGLLSLGDRFSGPKGTVSSRRDPNFGGDQ